MSSNNLPTEYQRYIHLSRYSRWDKEKNRRESYPETLTRYFDFFQDHIGNEVLTPDLRNYLEEQVLSLSVMPSMRCLMSAGPALKRENIAGYNCSHLPIDNPRAFDEALYILMNGTGVGFSVESDYIEKLPVVSDTIEESQSIIIIEDSKEGWARGLRELIGALYQGSAPNWDLSMVRPAGSILKTFGGRASGPDPLNDLFTFIVGIFKKAVGRKLNSIECHDIMCKIGFVVVCGGVRRSALISLSDLSDDDMRTAKSGAWSDTHPYRGLANNSVCYEARPLSMGTFMKEWLALYESRSGERGIFNRDAAKKQVAKNGRRDPNYQFGTNPCSEIILRPNQFCNLTEVVARSYDTLETLKDKVKAATILGTFQSTLTNFKYIRKMWKNNTEEERLLGVSLTGIMDCPLLTTKNPKLGELLNELKEHAIAVNKDFSERLGVPQSTAVTCVKPSGTVSQLVDSSSGIHARHNPYYIRNVRTPVDDPITSFMLEKGFPAEVDVMNSQNMVVSFPTKAPDNAICRDDMTALEQLKLWSVYAESWCEHKPSVTITLEDDEWMSAGAWVHDVFHTLSGISFLPSQDHTYLQAPYIDITKTEYEELLMAMPKNVDWSELSEYEEEDYTTASQELACAGGSCDII